MISMFPEDDLADLVLILYPAWIKNQNMSDAEILDYFRGRDIILEKNRYYYDGVVSLIVSGCRKKYKIETTRRRRRFWIPIIAWLVILIFSSMSVIVGDNLYRQCWNERKMILADRFYICGSLGFLLCAMYLVYVCIKNRRRLKNLGVSLLNFVSVAFSRENYFKSSILVMGFVIMICLIAIALHLCL